MCPPVWTQPQASYEHVHASEQEGRPALRGSPNSVSDMGDIDSHFTNTKVQNGAEDSQVLSQLPYNPAGDRLIPRKKKWVIKQQLKSSNLNGTLQWWEKTPPEALSYWMETPAPGMGYLPLCNQPEKPNLPPPRTHKP